MDPFLINKVWERLQRRNQVMNRTLRPTGTVIEKKIGYGPYFKPTGTVTEKKIGYEPYLTAFRNGYRTKNSF